MRKKNQPGCRCGCSTCTGNHDDITVLGCFGVPLSGVTVTQSPGSATATTNGSGIATLSVPALGTYTYTPTVPTGYATNHCTITHGACGNSSCTITLVAASGYTCIPDGCCNEGTAPFVDITYPTTLFLSDAFGTVSLTKTGGTTWNGTAVRNATVAQASPDCGGLAGPTLLSNVNVTVWFSLSCGGSTDGLNRSGWNLTVGTKGGYGGTGGGGFPCVVSTGCQHYNTYPPSGLDCFTGTDPSVTSSHVFSDCPPSIAGSVTMGFGGTPMAQVYTGSASFAWNQ
jgi:hypothetical protein